MHHALEIHEILVNIFGHCCLYHTQRECSDLVTFARTCRAFKEPALDVLWEELSCLSSLVKCLPEVFRQSYEYFWRYSFSRPLTQIEWDILHGYTRRIRSIIISNSLYKLDWESIRISKPPTNEPLFPNLRHLYFQHTYKDSLLLLPLPSLISLSIQLHDQYLFEDSLESFAKTSPNLGTLSIHAYHKAGIDMSTIDPNFIRRWQNLQNVDCPEISLDANTLVHLSRMPALSELCFTLSSTLPDQIAPSGSLLLFSNLHQLQLHSQSLASISRLLSHTQLPAIMTFTVSFENRASKQDVFSFLTSLQTSNIGHTIRRLFVKQRYLLGRRYNLGDPRPVLDLEELQPCMAFSNLHQINFDIDWKVDLKDSELLTLASAWPRLKHLVIDGEWYWQTLGGITPNGLLQVLQKCPSLSRISLAINTRGYTEFPQSPASLGLTLPSMSYIDVLDSFIEAESVPAIAAFFAGIASRSNFSFRARGRRGVAGPPNQDVCKTRWDNVRKRVEDALGQQPS